MKEVFAREATYYGMQESQSEEIPAANIFRSPYTARIDDKYIPLAENLLRTFAKAVNMAEKK